MTSAAPAPRHTSETRVGGIHGALHTRRPRHGRHRRRHRRLRAPGAGGEDRRPPGAPLRRGGTRSAGGTAGDRRGRQGLHRRARVPRHQPAGRARVHVQGALQRGARARLPVALPPAHAGPRDDPRLQPLALRGRARRARQGTGGGGALALALRLDQRLRADARPRGHHDPQVLPAHLQGRPARALPGAARARGQALQVLVQRRARAAQLGRLPGGVRGRRERHPHRVGAVARHPVRREVVPEPDRGADRGVHARGDGSAAGRRPKRTSSSSRPRSSISSRAGRRAPPAPAPR